jgi:hypothetical protein
LSQLVSELFSSCFANRDFKTARIRQTTTNPCKIGQIRQKFRQKLGVCQNYFLPFRPLSNPPEFFRSGGENRHLATLASNKRLRIKAENSAGSIPGLENRGIGSFGVFAGEREDSIQKSRNQFRSRPQFFGRKKQQHAKKC